MAEQQQNGQRAVTVQELENHVLKEVLRANNTIATSVNSLLAVIRGMDEEIKRLTAIVEKAKQPPKEPEQARVRTVQETVGAA